MSTHRLQEILSQLIAYPSVTPEDKGCQSYLIEQLQALGFHYEIYNAPPVTNFYAQYGNTAPLFVFAGHTDVVAPGPLTLWHTPPFELTEKEGQLFGRGVADMKGAIAAMLVAVERLLSQATLTGSIGFLITSGEEGQDFLQGTPVVMQQLKAKNNLPTYCLVGEPSSDKKLGDTLKIGRRGSLNAKGRIQGKQGHVAYPDLAENPIHQFSQALAELSHLLLDKGNDFFPPSSLQITHLQSGGLGDNVIPPTLEFAFNIRYSTEQTMDGLKKMVTDLFNRYGLVYDITWQLSGEPFLTQKGKLLETTLTVIQEVTQLTPVLSTTGGTSDGRFIAPYGVEVIELGLCGRSIHQANESTTLEDLTTLSLLYEKIGLALLT